MTTAGSVRPTQRREHGGHGCKQLLDQLEQQARARAKELEAAGKLPAGFTARHYPAGPVIPRGLPCEPLPADWRQRLEEKWPDGERLTWAWRLAKDPDACAQLIQGKPVDPARLNQAAVQEAQKASLVQLVRPIDLLERNVA